MVSFFDPPRPDSASVIQKLNKLGIELKMITGDQGVIARELAGRLGMGTNILGAHNIDSQEMGALTMACEQANGFSEMFPEHKYKVVEALQAHNKHRVAMTGDGINDAPALKKADVGIAVSGAAGAAQASADIVLLEPGLSVIVYAVQESRRIFHRMFAYGNYRVVLSIYLLFFFSLSMIVLKFVIPTILAVLIALFDDISVLLIAYDYAIFSQSPEKWHANQFFFHFISIWFAISSINFYLVFCGFNIIWFAS